MEKKEIACAHSPLPWVQPIASGYYRIVADDRAVVAVVIGDGEVGGLGPIAKANAEFIVRAVNHRDELIAALKRLRNEVSGVVGLYDLRDVVGDTNMSVLIQRLAEADTALAEAEER